MTAAASTSSAVGIRSRVSGACCLLSRPTLVLLVVGVTPCAVFTVTGFTAELVPRVIVLVRAPLARECVSVAGVDLERGGRWGSPARTMLRYINGAHLCTHLLGYFRCLDTLMRWQGLLYVVTKITLYIRLFISTFGVAWLVAFNVSIQCNEHQWRVGVRSTSANVDKVLQQWVLLYSRGHWCTC